MSSKTCKDCAAWQHNTYREWHYCAQGQGDICSGDKKACKYFKSATIFQKITESPEVLAEEIIFCIHDDSEFWWTSNILDKYYNSRAEAIAATVSKLKEVVR